MTDEASGEDRKTVRINVFETNQPPSFQTIENQEIDEFEKLEIQLNVMDEDIPANSFIYGLSDHPSEATIDETGLFEWTPSDSDGGKVFVFDIVVRDDGAGGFLTYRQEVMVTVNEVNVAPVLDPIPPITLGELSSMRIIANAADDDDDPADTLTYSLENAPVGMRIRSVTGEIRWDLGPADVVGDYSFTVTVSDGLEQDSQMVEVTVVEPEIRIMTFGDSITQGLPHEVDSESGMIDFGVSYHTFLDANLSMPATYVGNPNDNRSDSGALIVGGDGSVISQIPPAAFTPPGVRESFAEITETVTAPNFAVVMVGTNDLMQLIEPNGDDTFDPISSGDFTSAGTFTDTDETGSTQHQVASIISRYQDLVEDIATQFPPSTKIIGVAIAPADGSVGPDDVFGGVGSRFDLAKADLELMAPLFNGQIQSLMNSLGDRYSYVNPGLEVSQLHDGLHPSDAGYEQIGAAIADFIDGNQFPELNGIGDQEVGELITLEFDADATDPDGHNLTYAVSENAPTGAMIDETTGEFTWTPTAAQGPNIYTFDAIVTDDGPGTFCASERIVVTVTSDDPYDSWLSANFAAQDLGDPGKEATIWGRQASPDGGEWANEFEFYLGTNPNVIDEPVFEVVNTSNGAKAVFLKAEDAPLDFVDIEWSDDLVNWTSDGITRQITGAVMDGKVPVEAEVVSSSERIFFQFIGVAP